MKLLRTWTSNVTSAVRGAVSGSRAERRHLFFEIGVWLKGFDAAVEVLAGGVLLFVTRPEIISVVRYLTAAELSEDPRDFVANHLLTMATGLAPHTKEFASIYLLSHGVIKGGLVIGLLRRKIWIYPLAILIFLALMLYQAYRWTLTHSTWLVLLTALDVVVTWLTWDEYRRIKSRHRLTSPPSNRS